ncbi:DNA polymerase III subunit delta, partial [Chloroflexota bacterium]
LVLIEDSIASSNPLFRKLSDRGVVKLFPLLRDAKLRERIQERVAAAGCSISPTAIELLVKLVGGNLWIMSSEIDKLLNFASGCLIEEDDVRKIVSYAQQVDVFAMIDAIIAFKVDIAEQLLEQLLREGATPMYLLFMITRQIRMIVRARELKIQGKPEKAIQNKLGLASEYALRKTLEQADRYSLPRFMEVYHQLLEADLAIKTGKYDGELALNILAAELCHR